MLKAQSAQSYDKIATYRLKSDLYAEYNNQTRSVLNFNTTTNVTFDLTLLQLLDVVSIVIFYFKKDIENLSNHNELKLKNDAAETIQFSGWLNLVDCILLNFLK